MLDVAFCRKRQRGLLEVLSARRVDAAVITAPHHVYYLSGHLARWVHLAGFILFADGRSLLVTANTPAMNTAADDVLAYEANWMGTLRQEQPAACAERIVAALVERKVKRWGFDASAVASQIVGRAPGVAESIDDDLHQLRRPKDADELALMDRANACTEAMYRRARQVIEPGVSEIEVYTQLHAAAVEAAGEPLTALLGNDFACGAPGGPPRGGRTATAGELYILDLGPAYRGYFADNCRAVAVDRRPTDAQMRLWQTLSGVFPTVESMVRPGVRCRDVFNAIDDYMKQALGGGMPHHLGHGVGLQPHEFPHVNPRWDDVFVEGEVFTIEPGFYAPQYAAGLRLENNYLVTETGVKNLTPYPMELV